MFKKLQYIIVLLLAPIVLCSPIQEAEDVHSRSEIHALTPGRKALDNFPLIDGHNDLPWVLYLSKKNQLKDTNLYNLTDALTCPICKQTDINKLKAGKIGAQFWVAFSWCQAQFKDGIEQTLEQIDVIKRFIKNYPDEFQYVTSADGILEAFQNKKIGSLIAVEGGHLIGNRLSILRMYYELGVRYMTLTHTCNTPWADASPLDTHSINNITEFGKKVVWEMNRLGMMVDLSHVSYGTMVSALKISKAPVIFSHSNAYALYPHHRNVRDDVLHLLKKNNGIIMINFVEEFLGKENVTINAVVKNIEYIASVCGIDCVGIGSDYSGVSSLPKGLEDPSKVPELFDLLRVSNPDRWTIENLEKLAGRNFIRVFKEVEKVRDSLKDEQPDESWIPEEDIKKYSEDAQRCKTFPSFNGIGSKYY